MTEERINELEIKVAYQEEALQDLDRVLCRHQETIERLQATCRELVNQVRDLAELLESGSTSPREKPPHY